MIGHGEDAVLVAGGPDTPAAEERDAAAYALVKAYWLLGTPGPRGWSSATWKALKALRPDVAAHYDEHEDWRATIDRFWPEEAG